MGVWRESSRGLGGAFRASGGVSKSKNDSEWWNGR
jgi:hypothetical protein